jgi:hypothetical protein
VQQESIPGRVSCSMQFGHPRFETPRSVPVHWGPSGGDFLTVLLAEPFRIPIGPVERVSGFVVLVFALLRGLSGLSEKASTSRLASLAGNSAPPAPVSAWNRSR